MEKDLLKLCLCPWHGYILRAAICSVYCTITEDTELFISLSFQLALCYRQPSSSFMPQCNFPFSSAMWKKCVVLSWDTRFFGGWSSSNVVSEAQQGGDLAAGGLLPQSSLTLNALFLFCLTFSLIYSALNLFPTPTSSLVPHVFKHAIHFKYLQDKLWNNLTFN